LLLLGHNVCSPDILVFTTKQQTGQTETDFSKTISFSVTCFAAITGLSDIETPISRPVNMLSVSASFASDYVHRTQASHRVASTPAKMTTAPPA